MALLEEGTRGRAYLLKERMSGPAQLVAAIVEVARGGSVVDQKVIDVLVRARTAAQAGQAVLLHLAAQTD